MKAILTYHSIDESGSVISVGANAFTAHMRWLADNVAVVPLADILTTSLENAVAITFDDGFQNFAGTALPALRDFGLPATVFVATDFVGKTNGWSLGDAVRVPELPLMDWRTLEQVTHAGITIGSHTRTHPDLRRVSTEQLQTEIAGAAALIRSRLGQQPTTFAYPYGEFDDASVRAVRASYTLACTTELRALEAGEDAVLIPRLDAYYFRRPGVLEQFGESSFRRFLWVRRHGRAVRRVLANAKGSA